MKPKMHKLLDPHFLSLSSEDMLKIVDDILWPMAASATRAIKDYPNTENILNHYFDKESEEVARVSAILLEIHQEIAKSRDLGAFVGHNEMRDVANQLRHTNAEDFATDEDKELIKTCEKSSKLVIAIKDMWCTKMESEHTRANYVQLKLDFLREQHRKNLQRIGKAKIKALIDLL